MSNSKQETNFNFEQQRKTLCNQISYKLRNPELSTESRKKFLVALEGLIEKHLK